MGGYGARDRANRGTARKLAGVLDALGVDYDVKEYPEAGHAFLNDHEGAGDRDPWVFRIIGLFSGPADYDAPSAADSRRRIASFFNAHLET